jgi:hypothetical protein
MFFFGAALLLDQKLLPKWNRQKSTMRLTKGQ